MEVREVSGMFYAYKLWIEIKSNNTILLLLGHYIWREVNL